MDRFADRRHEGRERVRKVTTWVIGGGVALTGVFSVMAARAFPGTPRHSASPSLGSTTAGASSDTPGSGATDPGTSGLFPSDDGALDLNGPDAITAPTVAPDPLQPPETVPQRVHRRDRGSFGGTPQQPPRFDPQPQASSGGS